LKAAQDRVDPDSIYGRRIALVAEHIKPLSYRADQLGRERKNVPLQLIADRSGMTVNIDGKLDDPFWDVGANKFSGSLKDTSGEKAPFRTRFTAAWADNNLYLGIYCQDRPENTVYNTATDHDQPSIWRGDVLEILMETQVHSYYQLAISPAGALVDVSHEDGRLEFAWSSNAQVATHVGEDYWSAEVRIPIAGRERREVDPLDGVAGFMPTHDYPWYFNVCRQRVREADRQLMAFSPTKNGFQCPDRFAKLVRHHLAEPKR